MQFFLAMSKLGGFAIILAVAISGLTSPKPSEQKRAPGYVMLILLAINWVAEAFGIVAAPEANPLVKRVHICTGLGNIGIHAAQCIAAEESTP